MKLFGKRRGENAAADPAAQGGAGATDNHDLARNTQTQKHQALALYAVLGVMAAGGMYYVLGSSEAEKDKVAKLQQTKTQISTDDMVGRGLSEKEWMGLSQGQIDSQGQQIKSLESQTSRLDQLQKQVEALSAENSGLKQDGTQVLQAYSAENRNLKAELDELKVQQQRMASAGPNQFYGAGGPATYQRAPGSPLAAPASQQAGAAGANGAAVPGGPAISPAAGHEIKMIAFGESAGGTAARIEKGKTQFTDSENYLPPNSIAPATVVVGVDATTAVKSQSDPLPVVLRITGPARSVYAEGKLLRTNLTGCMVNGAAMADLSSEKVYVKLQRMTCPQPGGRIAVSEVKGFIAFGGKTGVRGHVVSRAGNLVSKAFVAGIFGGVGRGASTNAQAFLTSPSVSVSGTRSTLSAGDIATGGLGQGLASSADMVSKYLIERAEQYQPVVEMPTGIRVEVVFLEGTFIRN